MNQMIRVSLLFTFFVCLHFDPLYAQIENADALPKQFDVIAESSIYWTPNLLQPSNAGLYDMARY